MGQPTLPRPGSDVLRIDAGDRHPDGEVGGRRTRSGGAAVGGRRPTGNTWFRPRWSGQVPWRFVAPAVLAFAALSLAPALLSFLYSFTDTTGLGDYHWVGWENYQRLLHDEQARQGIRNTVVLTILVVALQNLFGLLLALALHRKVLGSSILRAAFFLPVILSPVIIGYLWQYIYAPNGALNQLLSTFGLDGLTRPWLGDPDTALYAVIGTVVWQFTGYSMVIFMAGLSNVPGEFLEAAKLDGAAAFRRLWHVTLPLLAPATTINVALSLIAGLRLFDQVQSMTGGGPGYATETLSTVVYKEAFVFGELGYGAALSVVLTLLVAVATSLQVLASRRREVV